MRAAVPDTQPEQIPGLSATLEAELVAAGAAGERPAQPVGERLARVGADAAHALSPLQGERAALRLRPAYGFDDVAIVPGVETIHPDAVDIGVELGGRRLGIPFVASAMDGVVDVAFAIALGKLGGLAVLNLEGLQTRYERPEEQLQEIVEAPAESVTALMQRLYQAPIRDDLVGRRIEELRRAGVPAAVSATPALATRLGPVADAAGVDLFVVQATVATRRFRASRRLAAAPTVGYAGTGGHTFLDFERFCAAMRAPVVVGNTVSYATTLELLETGVAGILVGVGPGAACTSREVLGVGVPQVTATMECAAARDAFQARTGRYVPVITDGGMRTGGDICKAFASGADAVMIGSPFAQAAEAPGKGHHWGMATPHAGLPRGTRIKVGVSGTL